VTETIVRAVRRDDWQAWLALWDGYNAFYARVLDEAVTRAAWGRFFEPDEPVHALVAESEGRLVGLVHYIFHRSTGTIDPVCYLQDLFTTPEARGRGVGRALIEAVTAAAERAGSPRVYWLTHETNVQAQALYDKVAARSGFVQYRKELPRNEGGGS
jgi:GNAT superfamily N-acetyltransferase